MRENNQIQFEKVSTSRKDRNEIIVYMGEFQIIKDKIEFSMRAEKGLPRFCRTKNFLQTEP